MGEREFYTNLGKIIRRRRRELDITQSVLAKQLGVVPSYLCEIEKGKKAFSAYRIGQIARALKLDIVFQAEK